MNKEENKKYHREYMKEWVKKNPEKDYEIRKKYRNANREKLRKYSKEYHKKNPEKVKLAYLKRDKIKRQVWKYSITKEDYLILLSEQKNLCAICGGEDFSGKSLSIDHSHNTNKIRGLLCGHCNRGLGLFRDNIEFLEKAVIYLQKHKD